MSKIFKYALGPEERQFIKLQKGSQVLSVVSQYEQMVVYALVPTDEKETVYHEFVTYGTGHSLPADIEDFDFLGTCLLIDGALVIHVFHRPARKPADAMEYIARRN